MTLLFWIGCAPAPTPILVSTGHCSWTREVCFLDADQDLVLWVPEVGDAAISVDGQPLEFDAAPQDAGLQLTLRAPLPEGTLALELRGTQTWSDAFELKRPPPQSASLANAAVEERAGPSCEASLGERVDQANPEEKGEVLARWAGCDFRAGSATHYVDRLEQSLEAHRAAGQHSLAERRRSAILNQVGWEPERLARLYASPPYARDANAHWARHHGDARLHERRGAFAEAEQADAQALAVATRHGLLPRVWRTQNVRAIRADALGDVAWAIEILNDPDLYGEGGLSPAYGWIAEKNLLWFAMNGLSRSQAGGLSAKDVRDRLAHLEAQADVAPANETASLQIDIARASLLDGATEEAREAIRQATQSPHPLGQEERHWVAVVQASLLETSGDAEGALSLWSRTLADAQERNQTSAIIRAHLGLARLSAREKRVDQARENFERARALIREVSRTLPFDMDRGAWFSNHEALIGAQLRLELETDAAMVLELMREASSERLRALDRIARSRALQADSEWNQEVDRYQALRNDAEKARSLLWSIPDDEKPTQLETVRQLEKRASDTLEALLANTQPQPVKSHTLESDVCMFGWWPDGEDLIAVGQHQGQTQATLLSREASDTALLQPFAAWLPTCSQIRLLAGGHTSNRDLHAAEIAGKPLLSWAPVVWTLDVGAAEGKGSTPLIVGDPLGDLPNARAEATHVARSLDTTAIVGAQATRSRVLNALTHASSAHLATHAARTRQRSGLRLADGTLEIGDVLALSQAPSEVFLSGCDTATTAYGLGIAQAFGLAGSNTVIASIRPVSDIHTESLVQHWLADHTPDGATRLARAQLALRTSHPDADWSAWRVWAR